MTAFVVPLADGGTYLNLGDADRQFESRVVSALSSVLEEKRGKRILKISHHGSRFSTPEVLLKIYNPDEAWISSGLGNRHGHPHAEVLMKLRRWNIRVLRTDQEGSLKWTFSNQKSSTISN